MMPAGLLNLAVVPEPSAVPETPDAPAMVVTVHVVPDCVSLLTVLPV